MTQNDERDRQLAKLRDAVDRKAAEAEEASHQPTPRGLPADQSGGDQRPLEEPGRTQDVRSVRDKNAGHGHKTADKWNQ
jgi:hypothetical protein